MPRSLDRSERRAQKYEKQSRQATAIDESVEEEIRDAVDFADGSEPATEESMYGFVYAETEE